MWHDVGTAPRHPKMPSLPICYPFQLFPFFLSERLLVLILRRAFQAFPSLSQPHIPLTSTIHFSSVYCATSCSRPTYIISTGKVFLCHCRFIRLLRLSSLNLLSLAPMYQFSFTLCIPHSPFILHFNLYSL